jgi:hypothetical protein
MCNLFKQIKVNCKAPWRLYAIALLVLALLLLSHVFIGKLITQFLFPYTTLIQGTLQFSVLMLVLAITIAVLNFSPKRMEYWLAWCVVACTYYIFRRWLFADTWDFYTLFDNGYVAFVDVLFLALLPFYNIFKEIRKGIINLKKLLCCISTENKVPQGQTTQNETSDIMRNAIWNECTPINYPAEDIYNFKELASELAKIITNPKHQFRGSFCIAIKATWGNGKSSFVNLLKHDLRETDNKQVKKYIEIDYNPWLTQSKEDYTQDLLFTIASKTTEKDGSLAQLMRRYAESMRANNPSLLAALDMLGTFFNPKSREESYQKKCIHDYIVKNKIKLFVYIDDVDRLVGQEIISFLKVLRGATDFPNTFFIVSIDHDYLVGSLLKHNHHDPNNYLRRFFQLEYELPDTIVKPEKDEPDNSLISIVKELMSDKLHNDENDLYVNYTLHHYPIDTSFSVEYALRVLLNNKRDQVLFMNRYKLFSNKEGLDKIAFFWCTIICYKYGNIWKEFKFNPETYLDNTNIEKCVLRQSLDNTPALNIESLLNNKDHIAFYNISISQRNILNDIFLFLFNNKYFSVPVSQRNEIFKLL